MAAAPTRDAILATLSTLLSDTKHAELVGNLKDALQQPDKPQPARAAEQVLQSALSVLTDREKKFKQSVDDVEAAKQWYDDAVAKQEQAALDLVQAQNACAKAQADHSAKLAGAARGAPQVGSQEAFKVDSSMWDDLPIYGEGTRAQMEQWKQELDQRLAELNNGQEKARELLRQAKESTTNPAKRKKPSGEEPAAQ